MTRISISVIIRRPKNLVYETLKHMERYPSFLRDVKKITIHNTGGNKIVSDWKIDIEGTPVEWKQENTFNENKGDTVTFKMLEGDYELYEGSWELEGLSEDTTRVKLKAQFQWGVPGLERYVSNVLEEKAINSLKGMLFVIRKQLHKKEHV